MHAVNHLLMLVDQKAKLSIQLIKNLNYIILTNHKIIMNIVENLEIVANMSLLLV